MPEQDLVPPPFCTDPLRIGTVAQVQKSVEISATGIGGELEGFVIRKSGRPRTGLSEDPIVDIDPVTFVAGGQRAIGRYGSDIGGIAG